MSDKAISSVTKLKGSCCKDLISDMCHMKSYALLKDIRLFSYSPRSGDISCKYANCRNVRPLEATAGIAGHCRCVFGQRSEYLQRDHVACLQLWLADSCWSLTFYPAVHPLVAAHNQHVMTSQLFRFCHQHLQQEANCAKEKVLKMSWLITVEFCEPSLFDSDWGYVTLYALNGLKRPMQPSPGGDAILSMMDNWRGTRFDLPAHVSKPPVN